MRLAYVTTYDVLDISSWMKTEHQAGNRGTAYHLAKNLENQSIGIDYINSVNRVSAAKKKPPLSIRIKYKFYSKFSKKRYEGWADPSLVREYASQISSRLFDLNSDVVLSPENISILSFAYLKCKQPLVAWVDTSLAGLINFYPSFSNFCNETKKNIYAVEKAALEQCQLIIFPSDWAAQVVIKTYGIEPSKIKVITGGSNLECDRTNEDINNIVESKTQTPCRLLFIGVDWFRKGGDIAFEVVKQLNELGLITELVVLGCQPIATEPLPSFVKTIKFINKYTNDGLNQMNKLFCESHFLIMPSRAETYGRVLGEANSFGLPCLTTNVGGIPSIIRDDLNGKTFSLNASISEYCNYIFSRMTNYQEYKRLAYSSFNEYQSRLNWTVAVQTGKQLIRDLV